MLKSRQVKILSTLIGFEEGISVFDLANYLNCSTKTINNEIVEINELLGKSGQILMSPERKLILEQYDVNLVQTIRDSFSQNIEEYYDYDRTHRVLLILFYEDDYLSMESLANKLYISKSALSKLFNRSWRLREYVEVNPTKGLRINWKEKKKRNFISKNYLLSEVFETYVASDVDFSKLDKILLAELGPLFISHEYYISGGSMNLFRVYLIVSIMRSMDPKKQLEKESEIEISSLMQDIQRLLEKEFDIKLNTNDLFACQRKLNELNVLNSANRVLDKKKIEELNRKYDVFIRRVELLFQIKIEMNETQYQQFILHMYKLLIRHENNTDVQNFSKRDINTNYPFTALVIRDIFCPIFELSVAESELSFVILYFAQFLEVDKDTKLLLVSDAPASLIVDIKRKITDLKQIEFESLPTYYFESISKNEYDVIITTEMEVVTEDPKILLISSIISKQELYIIDQYVAAVVSKNRNNRFNDIEKLYYKLEQIHLLSMQDFIDSHDVGNIQEYDIVLNHDCALFMTLRDDESFINVYELSKSVLYKDKQIKKIVYSNYNVEIQSSESFFSYIRHLIQK